MKLARASSTSVNPIGIREATACFRENQTQACCLNNPEMRAYPASLLRTEAPRSASIAPCASVNSLAISRSRIRPVPIVSSSFRGKIKFLYFVGV